MSGTSEAMSLMDEQIRAQVLHELANDPRTYHSDVSVRVLEGVVTLGGQVDCYRKKWAVQQAALRVKGVRTVTNVVQVQFPSNAECPDAELAHRAVSALTSEHPIPIKDLQVSVSHGWVKLAGQVPLAQHLATAEQAILSLAGVRGVVNLLQVEVSHAMPSLKQQSV